MMVASATPATPIGTVMVSTRSSTMLMTVAIIKNSRDVRLSPKPCRMPALMLKPRLPITPMKMMTIYVFAISNVPSSGTFIMCSSGSLKKIPISDSGMIPMINAV